MMGGRTLRLVSLALASLTVSSAMGKSIVVSRYFETVLYLILFIFQNGKSENPCLGKYYCETPPDYPAALILNLLRNQHLPRGLIDGQEDKEKSEELPMTYLI